MIRHSSLPKLAECPCYESAGGSNPATERGLKMDEAFRFALSGDATKINELPDEERGNVGWAITQVCLLAAGGEIISDEESLKVVTPGIEHIGTEDARVPSGFVSFDLKSGQIRGYEEQVAAYAYGNMERDFAPEWTCHLLFCDQQKIVTHKFTYDEAKAIVEKVLAEYNDPNKKPNPCQYCGWCSRKDTCQALAVAANDTLAVVDTDIVPNLAQLKEFLGKDNERLSAFVKKAAIFNDELVDWAKETIKSRLTLGEEFADYKLQKQKPTEYVESTHVVPALQASQATTKEIVEFFDAKVKAADMKEFLEKKNCGFEFGTFSGKEIVKLVPKTRKQKNK